MTESSAENQLTGDYITDKVLISIRQIIQAIDLHSRELVRKFGLTVPQLVILQTISKEKSLTVGAIAKEVSLSQATVTGILERLHKRGFVVRTRSEIDRRRVMIEPTEKCMEFLEKAPPLMQEIFVKQFGELEQWEKMMILSSLQRIVSLMDVKAAAVGEEAPPYLTTGQLNENP